MTFTRLHITLAAGLVAAAGTIGAVAMTALPASAGPAASAGAASAKAVPVVLVNQCTGKGQTRPSTIWLPDCPSGVLVGGAKWTSWGSVAFGSGRLEVDNCTPSASCGPSKYTKYPILIVLWRAERWAGKRGTDYFSRVTWIFTGKRPNHVPVSQTTIFFPAAQ
jgi:hypothetical protein